MLDVVTVARDKLCCQREIQFLFRLVCSSTHYKKW